MSSRACGYRFILFRRRTGWEGPGNIPPHNPMTTPKLAWIANYNWGIAGDVLRDIFVLGKYRDVYPSHDRPPAPARRPRAIKNAALATKAQLDEIEFFDACIDAWDVKLRDAAHAVGNRMGLGLHLDHNRLLEMVKARVPRPGVKMKAKRKLLLESLVERDEAAAPVVKKVHRRGTVTTPVRSVYEVADGVPKWEVEYYDPGSGPRDTGQIPLQEKGGIEISLPWDVLPHAGDMWHMTKSVTIGHGISLGRCFYKARADADAGRGWSGCSGGRARGGRLDDRVF